MARNYYYRLGCVLIHFLKHTYITIDSSSAIQRQSMHGSIIYLIKTNMNIEKPQIMLFSIIKVIPNQEEVITSLQ